MVYVRVFIKSGCGINRKKLSLIMSGHEYYPVETPSNMNNDLLNSDGRIPYRLSLSRSPTDLVSVAVPTDLVSVEVPTDLVSVEVPTDIVSVAVPTNR